MEGREGNHFTTEDGNCDRSAEKKSPVTDMDPGFTKGLEGLCAFNSPNQFSSSPEVSSWRQENGSIYQQRESSPSCLVKLAGRSLPHFRLASEVLRAGFPFQSKFTSPRAPPLLCHRSGSLGPLASLSAHQDLKAHLDGCAQEKAGGEHPSPAREGMEQLDQGQAKSRPS